MATLNNAATSNSNNIAVWNYAYSATGDMLIVGYHHWSSVGSNLPTATYNGVPMNRAYRVHPNNSAFVGAFFWLANPAQGSNIIAITISGASNVRLLTATSYTGLDAPRSIYISSPADDEATITVANAQTTDWCIGNAGNTEAGTAGVGSGDTLISQRQKTGGIELTIAGVYEISGSGSTDIYLKMFSTDKKFVMFGGAFPLLPLTAIAEINGVTYANFSQVNGVLKANIASINGVE